MQVYGIKDIPDNEIDKAIQEKYTDPDHISYAQQIAQIAGEYTNKPMVVGWNHNSKMRTYRRACKRFLTNKAKEQIKPVGILPAFIFMAILSGIISWITQILLKKYFNSTEKVDEKPEED